jgi:Protein of unknown function (DUF3383)
MASALDTIVNINISAATQAVPQAGFGIPLIVGDTGSAVSAGDIAYFTSTAGYVTAGGSSSDPEYKHLSTALSQALVPTQVGVGTRTDPVAQVDTITPVAVATTVYSGTLNELPWTFTSTSGSPTLDSIILGIKAAIDALSQPVTVADVGPGTDLTITANVAGNSFTTTLTTTAHQTLVHTTANHGIADDLNTLLAYSDLWYGLDITSSTDADILEAASWTEGQKKIFIGASDDSAIYTSSTSDLASLLQGFAYKRTALYATKIAGNLALGPAAAWLGGLLPTIPGSNTWKFKQLVGISPDAWTPSQRAFMIGVLGSTSGKNCNIYEPVGGVPITEEGWMVGGQFIDATIGIDWLESTMQTNVFAVLVNAAKAPYTDQGASIIKNAIFQTLGQGVTNGFIDGSSPIVVNVPLVASVSSNTRAMRVLPDITFSCRGAGALHGVQINGTVTV